MGAPGLALLHPKRLGSTPERVRPVELGLPWTLVLVTVILLGSGLRLANLEAKPYWFNEVFTSLNISGYDEHRDVNPALYTGALLGTDDLLRYQRLRPDSSVLDVIQTLRRKDVKWPPGYPVLARSWSRVWGTSVLVMRRLPALVSLLAFPALYWLSRELFESRSVAWMATALHAASPMFLAQAQEARPWSLWVAIMVAATAILLWALRTRAAKAWWLYAVCASASLYVNALSLLVIGVHGIHVLLRSRGRWEEPCRRWSLSTLTALASFAPWAACIAWNYQNAVATSNHLRTWPGLHVLAAGWAEDLRRVFLVPPAGPGAPVLFVAVLALVCYSFWVLWRDAPLRTSTLVTILTAAALVVVLVPDLVFHTQVSSRARYMFSSYLGVQLSVAHLLIARMTGDGARTVAWRGLALALLAAGLATCVAAVRADTWWDASREDVVAGRILAGARRPLIVTEVHYGVIAPLAHQVKPDAHFILFGRKTPVALPAWDGEVFVYRPSTDLAQSLAPYGVLRPACAEADRNCLLHRLHAR